MTNDEMVRMALRIVAIEKEAVESRLILLNSMTESKVSSIVDPETKLVVRRSPCVQWFYTNCVRDMEKELRALRTYERDNGKATKETRKFMLSFLGKENVGSDE